MTIPEPQYVITNPLTQVPQPSPNPVSNLLKPEIKDERRTFPIIFPISPDGGKVTGSLEYQKLNVYKETVKNGLSAKPDPVNGMLGLSLYDFSNFALQAEQAIDKLDGKIREILDGSPITCP